MTKALDLGCGPNPNNPYKADDLYGVDIRDGLGSNIRNADLAIEAIPFDSDYFDYVTAYQFLEHVPRLVYLPQRRNSFVELMNEIYRVLKPGGFFLSVTPAFPHPSVFQDPTHVNVITEETFPKYFDDQYCWARMYGFVGEFNVFSQEWMDGSLVTQMKKV